MDPFSYLSVLTSIILALGITRLLSGVGRLLPDRSHIQVYWVHLLWTLNVFLYLVLNWWILFRWHSQQEWSFFLFLFVLFSPTIAYLLTVLLMPDPFVDGLDLKQHFLAEGPLYVLTILLMFILSVVAAKIRDERFHAFFVVFFMIYLLGFITINLRLLG